MALAACASLAPAQTFQEPQTIFWQSRQVFQPGVDNPMSDLYASMRANLRNGVVLPRKVVQIDGPMPAEEILRAHNLLLGKRSTDAELLLCDLNPTKCSTQNGIRIGDGPGDTIVLPYLRFEGFPEAKTVELKATDSLEKVVVDEVNGCVRFDPACRGLIAGLNPGKAFVLFPGYAGPVVVPVTAVRTQFTVERRFQRAGRPLVLPREAILVPEATDQAGPGLRSSQEGEAGSLGERWRLLQRVHHPFADQKKAQKIGSTTGILVFDNWIVAKHCMYSPYISTLDGGPPPAFDNLASDRSAKCGELIKDLGREFDHGTHVVGIIGSDEKAALGPGVNPYAKVVAKYLDGVILRTPLAASKLISELSAGVLGDPTIRVISMSMTYEATGGTDGKPSNDLFENFLSTGAGSGRLVVAATGKAGAADVQRSRGCIDRPGCLNLGNVLTVTATNLTDGTEPAAAGVPARVPGCPNLLPGMATGEGVDLAAPGEQIVSTVVKDMTGVLSGSSQATPVVAGAASLLFAKDFNLDPLTVKNRLIYSADICPNLRVLGGLLNVKRSLAFERSQLRLENGVEIAGHFTNPDGELVFFDNRTGKQLKVGLQLIKRLYRIPGGSFVLLYHDVKPGARLEREPLTRAVGRVISGTFDFAVDDDPNNAPAIELAKALDYLSRIDAVAH